MPVLELESSQTGDQLEDVAHPNDVPVADLEVTWAQWVDLLLEAEVTVFSADGRLFYGTVISFGLADYCRPMITVRLD